MLSLERKELEPNLLLKFLLYFFAFVYPFVLENARMFESVESYGLVRIFPLPKSVRLIEILFFLIMGVYTLLKTYPSSNGFFRWKELVTIFVSMVVGIFVKLLND